MSQSYWVFPLTKENWEITRNQKILAVRTKNISQKIGKDDFIVLYVIGTESFCTILQVLESWTPATRIVWADEKGERKIEYPYQAKVEIVQEGLADIKKILPKLSFIENKQKWGVYFRGAPANMGRPIPEFDCKLIYEAMESNPLPPEVTELFKKKPKIREKELEKLEKVTPVTPKHNEIRDMIFEIGEFEGRIAEVEYSVDNLRLDVIWKTIPTGIPKWAFEVQLDGNFYEALTKLKHAWDKWNSKTFLITTEEHAAQAYWLLEDSFHELKDDARITEWKKIFDLYQSLKNVHKIKSEIRL